MVYGCQVERYRRAHTALINVSGVAKNDVAIGFSVRCFAAPWYVQWYTGCDRYCVLTIRSELVNPEWGVRNLQDLDPEFVHDIVAYLEYLARTQRMEDAPAFREHNDRLAAEQEERDRVGFYCPPHNVREEDEDESGYEPWDFGQSNNSSSGGGGANANANSGDANQEFGDDGTECSDYFTDYEEDNDDDDVNADADDYADDTTAQGDLGEGDGEGIDDDEMDTFALQCVYQERDYGGSDEEDDE